MAKKEGFKRRLLGPLLLAAGIVQQIGLDAVFEFILTDPATWFDVITLLGRVAPHVDGISKDVATQLLVAGASISIAILASRMGSRILSRYRQDSDS